MKKFTDSAYAVIVTALIIGVGAVSFGSGVQVGREDAPPVTVTERTDECIIAVLPAAGGTSWEVRSQAQESQFFADKKAAIEVAVSDAANARGLVRVHSEDGRIEGWRC